MTYSFWQFAFTEQTLAKSHFFFTFEDLVKIILHFCNTTDVIFGNGISKLFQSEFNIMEIGNYLAKRLIHI